MSYSCHHYLIPVCFQHPKKNICTIYQSLAFPLRLAVGHHLLSVSRDRPLLDILYTWNRILCGLSDWLLSLSINVSKVHAHCSMCQCFLLWPSNISLCGYFVMSKWAVTFDPFICWKIFGCFPFGLLWIMQLCTLVSKFLCGVSSLLLDMYRVVELLGHSVTVSVLEVLPNCLPERNAISHSYQQCLRPPISWHLRQLFFSVLFWFLIIVAILVGGK